MTAGSNDMQDASSQPNVLNRKQKLEGNNDKAKAARHPRWTRQETLVLIQGKKVVESQIREGHQSTSAFAPDQNEPKWDSVASYCKQHGVNRRPVQCQKKWSNLLVDFKKIKTWESQIKREVKSFWIMRNDLRKEMKLPGFFDKEVYDVLDGGVFAMPAVPLTLITAITDAKNDKDYDVMAVPEEEEEDDTAEAVFDSSRHAPAEDGLFSDFAESGHKEIDQSPEKETSARASPTKTVATPCPLHISENQCQPFCMEYIQQQQDRRKENYPGSSTCRSTSQERWKGRRLSLHVNEDTNRGDRIIKVLERNNSMLNAQLEAQNINCQLDRDQRKEHSDSLIAAVNNLIDVLLRIANKL